jgi:hypothetical protein
MEFDKGLDSARVALKIGLGLAAFLAGLDKFFDLLANWEAYLSPLVGAVLPVSAGTFMRVAGVVEMAVGLAILTRWTRIGSYIAAVWLLAVAVNLLVSGRFLDVAVRDVEMAIAAYALARLTEVQRSSHFGMMPERAESPRRVGAAA